MRSYEAARTYFSILEFLSWCVIVFGGIAVFVGLGAIGQMGRGFGASPPTLAYFSAIIPGIGLAFAGFLGLVFCQTGRASVDSAEYGQQGLKIAREQLEISKQALKQGAVGEQGFAALQAAKAEIKSGSQSGGSPETASYGSAIAGLDAGSDMTHQPGETIKYRGKSIRVTEAGYLFGGSIFETLGKAKEHVDQDGFALPPASENGDETNGADRVIEYRGRKIGKFGQVFRLGQEVFLSADAAKAAIDTVTSGDGPAPAIEFHHEGRRVRVDGGRYTYDGRPFNTKEEAIKYINQLVGKR